MLQLNVAGEGLLICLFTVCQKVLSSRICDYYECKNNVCICTSRPSSGPSFELPSWSIIIIAIFGAIVGCSFLFTLCTCCCKFCKETEASRHTEEPTVRVSIPPPAFIPPLPSAPPPNQFLEPPPYAEAAWKPYCYPPPMDQPPAYDNIAMEGLPPLDASQPPGSALKDNS